MIKTILIGVGAAALAALMLAQSWPAAMEFSGAGRGDPTRPYSTDSDQFIKDNQTLLQSAAPNASMSPALRHNARLTLRRAPLSDDAILHLALADILEGQRQPAIALLEETSHRNARNRGALITLIEQYSAEGNIPAVLRNVDILYRLERDERDTYLSILDVIYKQAAGREEIGRYLEGNPEWGRQFLNRQIGNFYDRFVNIDDLSPLVKTYVAHTRDTKVKTQLIQRYLFLLTELGRVEEAYDYWQSLYGGNETPSGGAIQNGDFKAVDAAAPFNWQLFYSPRGGAELEAASGLFVFQNSEKPQLLARQYLALPEAPAFNLKANVSGRIDEKKGRFEWRLTCFDNGSPWHRTPITKAIMQDGILTETIAAPPQGCNFAALQLYGLPGEYADRFNLQIQSISLTPTIESTP